MGMDTNDTDRRNRRLVIGLAAIGGAMTGLSFASVPLYDMFCRATGFAGTPRRVAESSTPRSAVGRQVTIRFNADVSPSLPWEVRPLTRELRVDSGVPETVFFRAINKDSLPIVATATYNVTPERAGAFFDKIQCFCFEKQRLEPGQSIDMAVSFFVDPAMSSDPWMNDVKTITLSYTFFRAPVAENERPPQLAVLPVN